MTENSTSADAEILKRCNKCLEWKPLSEFHKQSNAPDGHQYRCKACSAARSVENRETIYAQKRERRREQRADPTRERKGSEHPYYTLWAWMKKSCYSPDHSSYPLVGARGITVCDYWLENFLHWLEYMGERPSPAHRVTRLDEDGNFEPGNVIWESSEERCARVTDQRCNKCGERKPLAEFKRDYRAILGVSGDCKDCWNVANQTTRAANPSARHGVSTEQYAALLAAQGGGCAIDATHPPAANGRYCVDHDHVCCPGETSCGECVRGLLCTRCNILLGYAKDSPATLRSGADYLERYMRAKAGDYHNDPSAALDPHSAEYGD